MSKESPVTRAIATVMNIAKNEGNEARDLSSIGSTLQEYMVPISSILGVLLLAFLGGWGYFTYFRSNGTIIKSAAPNRRSIDEVKRMDLNQLTEKVVSAIDKTQ